MPQLYLSDAAGESTRRLLGFERVELAPGETKHVTLTIDLRLLAHFNWQKQTWEIKPGTYEVVLGKSAVDSALDTSFKLKAQFFGK